MEHPHRKKLCLPDYDYHENGAYFITVCTRNKEKILCEILPPTAAADEPAVKLTPLGELVDTATMRIPGMETYCVMPNHVHMIVINRDGGSVPSKIKLWKSIISRKSGVKIWQKSYYDHVIRDWNDFQVKWNYIDENPAKWASDEYY